MMQIKLQLKYQGHGYYSLVNERLHYVTDEKFVQNLLNTSRKVGEVTLVVSASKGNRKHKFEIEREVNGDEHFFLINEKGLYITFNSTLLYHIWHMLEFEGKEKVVWIGSENMKVRG